MTTASRQPDSTPTQEALADVRTYLAKRKAGAVPAYAQEFEFSFEELALVTENGFEAGQVNGTAEISYWDDEGYPQIFIKRIWLDGYKPTTAEERNAGKPFYTTGRVALEEQSWLYLTIFGELDSGGWKFAVEDAVRTRIEREAA